MYVQTVSIFNRLRWTRECNVLCTTRRLVCRLNDTLMHFTLCSSNLDGWVKMNVYSASVFQQFGIYCLTFIVYWTKNGKHDLNKLNVMGGQKWQTLAEIYRPSTDFCWQSQYYILCDSLRKNILFKSLFSILDNIKHPLIRLSL